ncbi:MAG: circadian clock KaiB family protein [Thermodesulfobacteriota bacterium]
MNMEKRAEDYKLGGYVLRLFITGEAPNSFIAKENLRRLQKSLSGCRFEVEIVDVLKTPQVALEHGVYVTPALQIVEPSGPGALIFGNLQNLDSLRALVPDGEAQ